ncbi:MAG: hypothetical protein AAFZ63_01345 [Bacteroidota bacterium]
MPLQLKVFPRFFIYTLFFAGLLSQYSCQEQALVEELQIATNTDNDSGKTTFSKRSGQLDQHDVLERRMQWASYIAARIIYMDEDARSEVMELLSLRSTPAIGLDQLLVDGAYTPRFRELFLQYATYQLSNIDGDEQFFPEPDHNQAIPPTSRQNNLTSLHAYLDFLTVDNCLELFFVNAFVEGRNNSYYSTAHPLTIGDDNYGYKISYTIRGLILPGQNVNVGIDIQEAIADPDLADSGNKIIVCRPQRIVENPICGYAELERIDFRLFLNE